MKQMFLVAAAALSLTAGSALAASVDTTSRASYVPTQSTVLAQNVAGSPVIYGGYATAPAQTISRAQLNAQYQDSMQLSEQQGLSGNGGGN